MPYLIKYKRKRKNTYTLRAKGRYRKTFPLYRGKSKTLTRLRYKYPGRNWIGIRKTGKFNIKRIYKTFGGTPVVRRRNNTLYNRIRWMGKATKARTKYLGQQYRKKFTRLKSTPEKRKREKQSGIKIKDGWYKSPTVIKYKNRKPWTNDPYATMSRGRYYVKYRAPHKYEGEKGKISAGKYGKDKDVKFKKWFIESKY